jgi:predicted dehydrogenase
MSLSIGIIGLSSFYGPAFAERASARPDCSVVAVTAGGVDDKTLSTLGRPSRTSFAQEHSCKIADDADKVLELADSVVVATPTSRRGPDARHALLRDMPVLVAKPAAADYEAARELAATATETDTPLVFTRPARYDDGVGSVAQRVVDGTIGDVVAVRVAIRHDRVPAAGIDANAEHAPGEAGSAYAMSVYTADALLWLTDCDPHRVTAEYENTNSPHSSHPDLGTGTVRFNNGALGTMTMTYSTDCREAWGNWEVEVVGTDGILRTVHQGYEGIHWRTGDFDERSTSVFGRTTSPVLERLFDAFVETVRSGRPPQTPSAEDATAALGLCRAWEHAADSGRVILDHWPPMSLNG